MDNIDYYFSFIIFVSIQELFSTSHQIFYLCHRLIFKGNCSFFGMMDGRGLGNCSWGGGTFFGIILDVLVIIIIAIILGG
jgi:hypothetical protein